MSGKLITNEEITLSTIINDILPHSKDIYFLVGYFYFSGFQELYQQIGDRKLKILVGLDIEVDKWNMVKEYEKFSDQLSSQQKPSKQTLKDNYFQQFVQLFNRTNLLDTVEKQESFKLFYDKIKNGTLELRKTAEPNHAKMYLFAEKDPISTLPGHMIVGSSNLSYQGLKSRNELNVVFHDIDYNDGKELFDKLWDSAAILADMENLPEFQEKVIENIWYEKLPMPYVVYLRVLDEYFNINYPVKDFKSPSKFNSRYTDLSYQTDAIREGLDKIKRYNGVLIADVVGLGKSIIASTIAANLDLPVVIISPPHLRRQWEDYRREFKLRGEIFTSGKIKDAVKHYGRDDEQILVIIDEAHRYRNQKNEDYAELHQLCLGNKVILLTATPYNNKPEDIYALLKLFQIPGKSTLNTVNNLGEEFENLITQYNNAEKAKDSSDPQKFEKTLEDIVKRISNIIAPIIIRRSRKDLESISKYRKDLENQKISFPKVNDPQLLKYDLGDMAGLYLDTLERIYSKNDDEPQDNEEEVEGVYQAARYQPLKYIRPDRQNKVIKELEKQQIELVNLKKAQRNIAGFMRRQLVHRFESSIDAFKHSLENMINSSTNILNWIKQRNKVPIFKRGNLPDIDTLMESTDDTDQKMFEEIFDEQISKLEAKGLFELNIADMSSEFIQNIQSDIEILKSIYQDWFENDSKIKVDPKLNDFAAHLKDMLKKDPKRKIVVFSEFADTVNYLDKKLNEKNLPVFSYTSGKATKTNKATIRSNFDAGIPVEEQQNKYQILIATDAISEGYNLHRAGTIFNYDIPYNPTRVIQRIGRINRVNKKMFDELYIYNYFPTGIGEKDVKTKKIATKKMFMINALMGNDTKTLTENEELSFSKFNQKFRDEEDDADQKSWDTDYREEWEQAKGTPEYDAAKAIIQRSRIKRTEKRSEDGVLVFGKRGDDCVFKLTNKAADTPRTLLPEEALPLFKAYNEEQPGKPSNEFESLYQKTIKGLFTENSKKPLPKLRITAIHQIQVWENSSTDENSKEYLKLLQEVVKLNGLSDRDYDIIKKEKKLEVLTKKIDLFYLKKIMKEVKSIDSAPQDVILAEELI